MISMIETKPPDTLMNPTTDLPASLQTLHARESIRTTLARYCWSGDFLLVDAFAASFTDDAILEIKGMSAWHGREGIRQAVEQGFARRRKIGNVSAGRAAFRTMCRAYSSI